MPAHFAKAGGRRGRQLQGDAGTRAATLRLLGLVALFLVAIAGAAASQTLDEAVAAYKRGDHGAAFRGFRSLAERGNAKAQAALGVIYARGQGVPQDDVEAVRWYRRAAERGLAGAQLNLGFMYAKGRGVPRDDAEAVGWFHHAAEQGNAEAQASLGLMYENGRGVPRDPILAYKWYSVAASALNATALLKAVLGMRRVGRDITPGAIARARRLAWMWLIQKQKVGSVPPRLPAMPGTPPAAPQILAEATAAYKRGDYGAAHRGFLRHAERGNAKAQYKLGVMYAKGEGVPRDDAGAVRWFRRAAGQRDAEAQAVLGAMYEQGRGVQQSIAEAVRWYRRAAGRGYDEAKLRLGLLHERGRGVPRDTVRAYKWYYSLAASASNVTVRRDAVVNMRRVGRRMTQGAVARAEQLARAWLLRKEEARAALPRLPASIPPGRKETGDAPGDFGIDR